MVVYPNGGITMKMFVFAAFILCNSLFADMLPKHFHVDMQTEEGEWSCTKSAIRKGSYYEIWTRSDLHNGCELENIYIVSSYTAHSDKADMKKMMRKALFPVKYMPGTRTSVRRESKNEALFEWHTPSGHQAVVRLCLEPDMYHTISYLQKGGKVSEEEISRRADFLDSLKLTFSR